MATIDRELLPLQCEPHYRLSADFEVKLQQTSNYRHMPQNADLHTKIAYLAAFKSEPEKHYPVSQEQMSKLDEKSPALRRYTCQVIAPLGVLATICGTVFLKLLNTAGVPPYAKIITGIATAASILGTLFAWNPFRSKSDLMCETDREVSQLFSEMAREIGDQSRRDINMASFFRANINLANIRQQLQAAHVNKEVAQKFIRDIAEIVSITNEL